MERLAFTFGPAGAVGAAARGAVRSAPAPAPDGADSGALPAGSGRRDWAYTGLLIFTGLLFFRPQDLITPLQALHMAEIAALFALASLVAGRTGRGLPLTRLTPELPAVLAFGAVILVTAPFSIWMGGAVGTFTELYAKVVLIYVLMINTLTSPKRIERFMWLIVVASGYIASRAVLDYARGVNLIENGRVQGSVGGMFKNPNDLALNMVVAIPLAGFLMLRRSPVRHRLLAAACAVLMLGAIVASQSRSGTLGLAAMAGVFALYLMKRRPGLVFAAALAGTLALPLLPASYWSRVASITDAKLDDTGSREARSILLREAFDAMKTHPLTGVGAGQFKNYNPEGRQEAWRETHNVVLQVGSELGVIGLAVFAFLVGRAFYAPIQARRLLRAAAPSRKRRGRASSTPALPADEHDALSLQTAAMSAALVGWLVSALFASVAYHWTFYYLLALAAAPRDYLLARVAATRVHRRVDAPRPVPAVGLSV